MISLSLTVRKGQRTLWIDYQDCLGEARAIVNRTNETSPAYSSGVCKNCVWYSACIAKLESADDLTLIPELGRSKRDAMIGYVRSIKEFAAIDYATLLSGKKSVFSGFGPPTLEKLQNRAKLISKKDGKALSPHARRAANTASRTFLRYRGRSHAECLLLAWFC